MLDLGSIVVPNKSNEFSYFKEKLLKTSREVYPPSGRVLDFDRDIKNIR